jgi:hypothetical protein
MNAAEAAKILDASVEGNGPFNVNCPVCDKPSLAIFDVGTGVAEYMCGHGCTVEAIEAEIKIASGKKPKPNMSWADTFELSNDEADAMSNPTWIRKHLIIQGHVIAIPAPPNGGKTTIFFHIAGEIAGDYQVFYVNADVSGGDAKSMVYQAKAKGFTLMLPDMKAGMSMDSVVDRITLMNEVDADYSGIVFIFDTLKKMTDVISKGKSKALYKTLRGLSAKGMTIILLCHTNKYTDTDGKPIFEGTGDLRTDVDDMIYLIHKKNADGSMTVSTEPDKVRGTFKPITFEISPDREVTQADYVDVLTLKKATAQREADETIIEAVSESIQAGEYKQTEITAYCKKSYDIGWRTVERVLNEYRFPPIQLWTRQRAFQRNAWVYTLQSAPPFPVVNVKTGEGGEGGETGETE